MNTIFCFKNGKGEYTVGLCSGEGTRYPFASNIKDCKYPHSALAYFRKLEKTHPKFVVRESSKALLSELADFVATNK